VRLHHGKPDKEERAPRRLHASIPEFGAIFVGIPSTALAALPIISLGFIAMRLIAAVPGSHG
jgi:hypothetical protein